MSALPGDPIVRDRSRCEVLLSGATPARAGEPSHHVVYRSAVTDENGIVSTDDVAAEMGRVDWNPELPAWIKGWSSAEAQRPWPPEL